MEEFEIFTLMIVGAWKFAREEEKATTQVADGEGLEKAIRARRETFDRNSNGRKDSMNTYELFVIGRCLIAVMFIASVFGNANNWRQSISLMQIHHLPFPAVALSAALVLQSTGAICLIIGRFLYPAVFGLSTFVVMATVAIPLQDALTGNDRESALRIVGSNVAIVGALLLVLAGSRRF